MSLGLSDGPPKPPGLYGVLGVTTGASQEAIARAYRRRARAVHPDARPDDPTASSRFRQLTGAYEVLSDPARRAAYDRARNPTVPASPVPWSGRGFPERAWLGWANEFGVRTNGTEVYLDTRAPRPSGSSLWAGPVRMEGSLGRPRREVGPPWLSRHRELEGLAWLLHRLLTAEGSE